MLLDSIFSYWISGGYVMIALAIVAVALMYSYLYGYSIARKLLYSIPHSSFLIPNSPHPNTLFSIIKALRIFTTAAPLLGLFGTVVGMIQTFQGVAVSIDNITPSIAGGISQALITTQMGLVIAIPGLFMQVHLRRQNQKIMTRQ